MSGVSCCAGRVAHSQGVHAPTATNTGRPALPTCVSPLRNRAAARQGCSVADHCKNVAQHAGACCLRARTKGVAMKAPPKASSCTMRRTQLWPTGLPSRGTSKYGPKLPCMLLTLPCGPSPISSRYLHVYRMSQPTCVQWWRSGGKLAQLGLRKQPVTSGRVVTAAISHNHSHLQQLPEGGKDAGLLQQLAVLLHGASKVQRATLLRSGKWQHCDLHGVHCAC